MGERSRHKLCSHCQQAAAVLFRVQMEPDQAWIFVCKPCLLSIQQQYPTYRYGGTWKAAKKP